MFTRDLLLASAVAVLLSSSCAAAAPTTSPAIAAAVADTSRPAADVARDPNRKPAETLTFAGVKPGDRVGDFIANSGYFSRLFADVVGPEGRVYAVELNEIIKFPNVASGYEGLQAWAKSRSNLSVETVPARQAVAFAEPLDLFWISQNYHDLSDKFLGPLDVAAFNRQVYAALKPGGIYIVLDHAAAKGAPVDVTETLHRIEVDRVKREVEAAGFTLVGESNLLANPADPHTASVFNASIAGHTDQFLLKFRRPSGS
jgi:predicted methyltransferase